MSRIKWRNGLIISVVLTVFALVVGLLASDDNASGDGDAGSDTSTTVPVEQLSDDQLSELVELLTVSTISEDVRCVKLVEDAGYETAATEYGTVYPWDIKSLYPADQRYASDSPSTPFEASDPEVMRAELFTENCVDPSDTAGETLHWLANSEIVLGDRVIKFTDLNPWAEPWVGENPEDVINARAAEFTPLLDVEPTLKPDCVVGEGQQPSVCWTDDYRAAVVESIQKNIEWQGVAEKLNTLLTRFKLIGVQEGRASVLNYHLVSGGMVVGGLPAVGYNDIQEDLPALVFSLTRKDGCPYLDIGFNVHDKRFELFEPVCEPSTPPTTEPPTTEPPTTEPPTTEPPTTQPPTTSTTAPPTTTVPPSSTVPPTTQDLCPDGPLAGQPVPENGVCPKDPTDDVDVNPSVPPQVRGPGTTPVGQDPSPATDPVDSDTGCEGRCPGAEETDPTPEEESGTPGSATDEGGNDLPPGGDDGISDPEDDGVDGATPDDPGTGDPGGF